MLYKELKDLTRGLATYRQYRVVNEVYMESEKLTKKDAAAIWYLAFGRETQLPPRTLEQKIGFAKRLSKDELNRLFWDVYESEKPLIFDKKTGLHYTLLVGKPAKVSPYYELHLVIYHDLDIGTRNTTVILTGWKGQGKQLPCWKFVKDKSLIKAKKENENGIHNRIR